MKFLFKKDVGVLIKSQTVIFKKGTHDIVDPVTILALKNCQEATEVKPMKGKVKK